MVTKRHWTFNPVPFAYCFFIGRFDPQYGQAADCAPVHFTSEARIGPPHCEQVTGNKSARWICSTGAGSGLGAAGGLTGINVGAGGLFGSGGRVSSWKNDPKMMDRPINTKMPGHQCPFENIMMKINSQNKPGKGPRKCLGLCLNLLCLCIGNPLERDFVNYIYVHSYRRLFWVRAMHPLNWNVKAKTQSG